MSSGDMHARFNDMPAAMKSHVLAQIGIEKGGFESLLTGPVRKGGGKAGEGRRTLPSSIQAQLRAIWTSEVAPKTGFADYSEMLVAFEAGEA